jgi:transposase-like protein
MNAAHNQKPRVINVDKNAAYPPAIDKLKANGTDLSTNQLANFRLRTARGCCIQP